MEGGCCKGVQLLRLKLSMAIYVKRFSSSMVIMDQEMCHISFLLEADEWGVASIDVVCPCSTRGPSHIAYKGDSRCHPPAGIPLMQYTNNIVFFVKFAYLFSLAQNPHAIVGPVGTACRI